MRRVYRLLKEARIDVRCIHPGGQTRPASPNQMDRHFRSPLQIKSKFCFLTLKAFPCDLTGAGFKVLLHSIHLLLEQRAYVLEMPKEWVGRQFLPQFSFC
jgi:hypothetical protein